MSRERVFENAYLEYGSMESMTEPTGRKLFFLTDRQGLAARLGRLQGQLSGDLHRAQLLYPALPITR